MAKNTQLERFAREISSLKRQVLAMKQPGLGNSTIDGGAIQAANDDGTLTMIVGGQFDGTNTSAVVTGPTPPTPTVPEVTETVGALRIYWDGEFTGGDVAPMDFARVVVYAESIMSYIGDEPTNQRRMVGTIENANGGFVTVSLEPDMEYVVYLHCWSQAGKYSAQSQTVYATPISVEPPTVVPPNSPAIEVAPHALGFVVIAEDIDPTSQIDYHVSTVSGFTPGPGTLLATTRSQVMDFRATPDGVAFAKDTTYYFVAIAHNIVGDATPSAEVPGMLRLLGTDDVDEISVSRLVSGNMVAAVALLGSIQVGQITLDPNTGLQIPLANGGLISLPADGTAAQFLKVLLEATSLLVQDNFELRGVNNKLIGTFTIAAGITESNVGPTVTATWPTTSAYLLNTSITLPCSSLADGTTEWVTVKDVANAGIVIGIDKTTGVETPRLTSVHPTYYRSVCKVGTDWYVLLYHTALAGYYVAKYNSSWVFQTSWGLTAIASSAPEAIASDGSTIYVLYGRTSDNATIVRSMTTAGASQTTVFTASVGTRATSTLTSFWVGTADFGAQRFIIGSNSAITAWNSSGTRQTSIEWSNPNGEPQRGFVYDGSNFRVITDARKIWKLSPVTTTTARSVRFSKYDNDGTVHETPWSPATSFSQLARQWMLVTTPAPEDSGGADDPNAIRHYIQNAGVGSYYRQTDITAIPWSAIYGIPSTAGATAVSGVSFAAVSAPGKIQFGGSTRYIDGTGDAALEDVTVNGTLTVVGDATLDDVTMDTFRNLDGANWYGYDQPSGPVTVTTTVASTIPGLSIPITSPGTWAVYRVDINADISISTSGTSALVKLLVDGSIQTGSIRMTGQSGDRQSCYRSWLVTGLSAGAHTLTATLNNSANSTSATVNDDNSMMIMHRIV